MLLDQFVLMNMKAVKIVENLVCYYFSGHTHENALSENGPFSPLIVLP